MTTGTIVTSGGLNPDAAAAIRATDHGRPDGVDLVAIAVEAGNGRQLDLTVTLASLVRATTDALAMAYPDADEAEADQDGGGDGAAA